MDPVATIDVRKARFPAAILGAMREADFFGTYWRRRYLHVVGGAIGMGALLPTMADVEAILDTPGHLDADVAHFITFPANGRPVTRHWSVGVTPARPRDRSEPVNLLPADRWFPELFHLAAGLERAFDSPASLQLFWSAPGRGLNPHRDTNDSFIIQIAGTKRWLGTDITDDRPTVSGVSGAEFADDPMVFDLAPGDVLYKPSHAVHSTTSGDQPTLSLTCSIVTRTAADLVLEAMRERLARDPAWLERFPMIPGPDGSDDDRARPRIEAALASLADDLPGFSDLEQQIRSRRDRSIGPHR